MKTLLFAAAALALAAGTGFAPGTLRSAAAEQTAQTAAAAPNAPHYERQYHYAGSPRHPHWEAGWVLVK